MKKRKINKITLNRAGKGEITPKLSVPWSWLKKIGVTEENRNVLLTLEEKSIIISKEDKKMTVEKVLENLKKLIGEKLNYDDIVCAFEDFEEGGETEVTVNKTEGNFYDYVAYINSRESTQFLIKVEKEYNEENEEMEEKIIDVWIA